MNKVIFSLNYVTNFKPSKSFSENYTFSKNKNNIILCKNFIIFLYLIKVFLKKNTNVKIWFKPKHSKIETLLRPPYRHKISRHQISFSRYYIIVQFSTKLKDLICVDKNRQIVFFLHEISKYFNFFETNICYLHSVKIRTFFIHKKFFKLMNYK